MTVLHENIVVAADYSRILARVLNLREGQLAQLVQGTSLDPAGFMALEGYISWADQHRIITNAIALYGGEGLGLVAGKWYPLATHGLLGIASMASATVLEGLQTLVAFQPTRAQFSRLSLQQTPSHLCIQIDLSVEQDAVGRFLMEALLVSMRASLEALVGETLTGLEVDLNFPPPAYVEQLQSLLGKRLHFDQPVTRFRLPVTYAGFPVATHNAQTRRWAVDQCEQLRQRLQQLHSFRERVLSVLRQSPGQFMPQEQLARALNVSSRTLLRRLKEEGTTYKALMDEEQRRLAQYYVDNTRLSVEAIAACVGYYDVSSFRRAFKRWFGVPPSSYPGRVTQLGGKCPPEAEARTPGPDSVMPCSNGFSSGA